MSSIINTDATLVDACPLHDTHESPGEKPLWLDHVMVRINRLLDLPSGWDSYQARAVDMDSVNIGLDVLLRTMQPETPLPQIVPTSRGTIQLEWHLRGIDLEVEALPSGLLHLSYEDALSGEVIEDLTTSSLAEMTQALKTLSMRK